MVPNSRMISKIRINMANWLVEGGGGLWIGCARVAAVCNPHNYRSNSPVEENSMCVAGSSDLFGNKTRVLFKDRVSKRRLTDFTVFLLQD